MEQLNKAIDVSSDKFRNNLAAKLKTNGQITLDEMAEMMYANAANILKDFPLGMAQNPIIGNIFTGVIKNMIKDSQLYPDNSGTDIRKLCEMLNANYNPNTEIFTPK